MHGILLLVFLTADKPPEAATKEFEALRGTWQIVSAEEDGTKLGIDEVYAGLIDSVRVTDEKPKRLESRCDVYTVTFDPSASPKRLTATVAGGEMKGEKMLGIYKRTGDKLTVCWQHGVKDYPTEFKTTEGGGWILLHLERHKK